MNKKIIDSLGSFYEGDLIQRTELEEELSILFTTWINKKGALSPVFKQFESYMHSLSYMNPIESFFRLLSQFLTILYSSNTEKVIKQRSLQQQYEALKKVMNGKDIPIEERNPSSEIKHSFQYSFTEKDERSLDYAGIVTEPLMIRTYLSELYEFIDSAQSSLLDIEHDSDNIEALNKVFRCFHTAKSSSAMLGFKKIEILAHHMENMLNKVRNRELRVGAELTDVIFQGIGLIRDLGKVVETAEGDLDVMIEGFKAFTLTPYIQLVERITQEFQTKKIGEILKEMGAITDEGLSQILQKQKKEKIAFGAVAIKETKVTKEDINKALSAQVQKKGQQNYVKVNSQKISELVDMVGELVVNQSMIRQKITSKGSEITDQDINQMEEVTTSIKDMVLSMGMVPLNDIFQRLRVVVRNTARELDKLVSFNISGEDTEMDRSLVESIYDPLVHMVRNSVSHGIETPSHRKNVGKVKVGQIDICARYRGNGVEICVKDDGKGINPEVILDKAIKLGWIEESQRDILLDDTPYIYSLLFKPGFSTKDQADSISGRGVGMDVVMQNISQINGKVEIQSEVGQGSTFRIKLPLTLAIIDGFVTDIMGELFVIPFDSIEEILVHDEMEIKPMEGESPMGLSRGRYFPIVDFHQMLTGEKGSYSDSSVYICISYEEYELAIPVNRVIGKQEIVIKNLNELIRHQKLFYGGTIFGDGAIGFILDIEEIIKQFKGSTKNKTINRIKPAYNKEYGNESEKT